MSLEAVERMSEYNKRWASRMYDANIKELEAYQIAIMKKWFRETFENPVECCTHDSAEGGFQFMAGGPYDAEEQLSEMFGHIVSDELIQKLATELNEECLEWEGSHSKFGDLMSE